jgi:hypothetical protein
MDPDVADILEDFARRSSEDGILLEYKAPQPTSAGLPLKAFKDQMAQLRAK